jgi:hypothetical protein
VVDATARTIELDPLPGRWPVIAGELLGVVEVTVGADGPAARLVGAGGREPFTVVLRAG